MLPRLTDQIPSDPGGGILWAGHLDAGRSAPDFRGRWKGLFPVGSMAPVKTGAFLTLGDAGAGEPGPVDP